MKAGLTSSRPKLSILPRTGLIYGCRAIEYGADKYARGNYHGAPPAGVSEAQRLLGYVDAALRHLSKTSDALNRALGTGGDLALAAATRDMDASGGFPASELPDLAHALASLLIGVSCAVDGGLLPEDPGQPWKAATAPEAGLPQKDNPAAERARVAALREQIPPERRAMSGVRDAVSRDVADTATERAWFATGHGDGEPVLKRPRFEVVSNTPEAIDGRPSEACLSRVEADAYCRNYNGQYVDNFKPDAAPYRWSQESWPYAVVDNGDPSAVNDV
jgi:hypothetical protein